MKTVWAWKFDFGNEGDHIYITATSIDPQDWLEVPSPHKLLSIQKSDSWPMKPVNLIMTETMKNLEDKGMKDTEYYKAVVSQTKKMLEELKKYRWKPFEGMSEKKTGG